MAGADLDIEEDTAHIPSSRGFTLVAGQQLVGMILGFVVWALLARMLPVEDFGEFNAAFGVATMAASEPPPSYVSASGAAGPPSASLTEFPKLYADTGAEGSGSRGETQ